MDVINTCLLNSVKEEEEHIFLVIFFFIFNQNYKYVYYLCRTHLYMSNCTVYLCTYMYDTNNIIIIIITHFVFSLTILENIRYFTIYFKRWHFDGGRR